MWLEISYWSSAGAQEKLRAQELSSSLYGSPFVDFPEASSCPPHAKVSGFTEQACQENKVEEQGIFIIDCKSPSLTSAVFY